MLKLFLKLCLFIPLLAAMMYVSWRVDPSGLFWGRGFERQAAEDLIAGKYLDGYERLDGRTLNETYAKNVPKAPDILINGSSRSLQIDSSFVADGLTLYNAGNVGADIYDFFNAYYCFSKEGKAPKLFIMSVDPWIFNGGEENIDWRSDKEMYYEFISEELGFKNSNYEKEDPYKRYLALVDPAYFQASVAYYFRDKSEDVAPQIVPEDEIYENEEVLKRPDGAIIYDTKFRTRSADAARLDALTSANNDLLRMADYDELDPDYVRQFEAFVDYVKEQGSEIAFLLPPLHPSLYNAAKEKNDKYHCLFEVEDFIRQTAREIGAKVYGSYDPERRGVAAEDFLDGYHLRPESLGKIMPVIDID